MKKFTSPTQQTGKIGENLTKVFLVKHGFKIMGENITYKGGELDIIAQKSGCLYFFEVKTSIINVSRGTQYNPFQNISAAKLHKMAQTIQLWLNHMNVPRETPWQMDGLGVYLDPLNKKARILRIENINIM